jgi:hypothetical protein
VKCVRNGSHGLSQRRKDAKATDRASLFGRVGPGCGEKLVFFGNLIFYLRPPCCFLRDSWDGGVWHPCEGGGFLGG